MQNEIILLDGALGTSLWDLSGDSSPVWIYNLDNPDIVVELHKRYINAGSKIIATNTFGANRPNVTKESDYNVTNVVSSAMRFAKKAVEGTDAQVALDIGPISELLEPYGDLTCEDTFDIYSEMIDASMRLVPDYIFFETFMDIEMLKIAVKAASKYDVPVLCSMSFEPIGKTIMGNSPKDMIDALAEFDNVIAVGLNCSTVPETSLPTLCEFAKHTDLPLIFKPNAGLPEIIDGKACHTTGAKVFAESMLGAKNVPNKLFLGGCCGTSPVYIETLANVLR